jgi:hypothetical protein
MFIAALLTGVLALAGLAAAVMRRELPPVLTVAAIAALAVQGALVLNALGGVGIPRYTLAMWPAIMVALTCWSWSVLSWTGAAQLLPKAPRVRARKRAKKAALKSVSRSAQTPAELPELVDPAQLKGEPAKKISSPAVKPASVPLTVPAPAAAKEPEPVAVKPTKVDEPATVTVTPPVPVQDAPLVEAAEPVADAMPAKKVQTVELAQLEPRRSPTKKAQPVKMAEPAIANETAKEKEPAEAK